MAFPLNQTYVDMISAFRTDCENLLEKFKAKRSESFKDFVTIWKAFKFNLVYEKYAQDGLQLDFKEDTLQIAKNIMLNDHFVGGLFLVYGLYHVQEDPKSSVRLELEEFEKLVRMLKVERKTLMGTCQPGFLFAKLLKNDAFSFVKFSREFSMEGQNRSRLIFSGQPILMQNDKKVNAKEWLKGFLRKIDFVDDLKQVEIDYFNKKQKLKQEHPELNLALDMVPDDIIGGIEKALTVGGEIITKETPTIGEKRRRLKERKIRIKHRYSKCKRRSGGEEQPCSSSLQPIVKKKRGRGAIKGPTKLYVKKVINDPEVENETKTEPALEDTHLSLPDI